MSPRNPPPCPAPDTGPTYWRSLDQLADTPQFREWVEREFPEGASECRDPVSRRHFMKIMSASFMLAGVGLTGCRRPVEKIQPFSKMPEEYVHGVARYYATAMPARGSAMPLVVKSHEGRPIKIEGNAEHPVHQQLGDGQPARGGTDLHAQAAILNLYDADRAQRFAFNRETTPREKALDFLAATATQLASTRGKGLCVLLERSPSPSRARLIEELRKKYPEAHWFVYEPVDFDVHREAATATFGKPVRPLYHPERARRILSLDCDFLGGEEDTYRMVRGFAKGRRLQLTTDDPNRLYVVESLLTITGTNADHRLGLPATQVARLAGLVCAEVLENGAAGQAAPAAAGFAQALRQSASALSPEAQKWARACAKDLLAHAGHALVVAGYRQPLAVHVLAQTLNSALGRTAPTVTWHEAVEPAFEPLVELARRLNNGSVETLVILGGNPVHNAPADLDWARTQRKARTTVRLGYQEDETFPECHWHLPMAHFLESWGDARTADGTWVPVQPLIEPLFGGLTELEVLARLGGLPVTRPHDIVRTTFEALGREGVFEENWKKFLHDGFLAGTAAPPVELEVDWEQARSTVAAATIPEPPTAQKPEVVFALDYSVDDGRYLNNGWLQELPDPITKITWDNAILLSPGTAKALGVVVVDENKARLQVPVVEVVLGGRTIEGPAWIQPGLADGTIGLTLGYGRPRAGRVGRGTGYNAYPLRSSTAPYLAPGAELRLTARTYPLSCTQNHWFMQGRPIIREATLEEYRKNARFAQALNLEEPPAAGPIYPNPLDELAKTSVHQWGMSIDLGMCVGCSACVIACQSENNIPIVGKDQVRRGREMQWMRIDRYFVGGIESPQVIHQPMMCQHCEAAPCESVCPVNATVHDPEGLNLMAYNRCVGTRYCSNNCPYKVRRFNFFDYNRRPIDRLYHSPMVSSTDGEWEMKRWFRNPDRGSRPQDEWDLLKLARNPDVTVRMRGVMEKCTFCLQRIEEAKIARKVKAGASGDIEVRDGTIRTACEQACPADAIVFGNLKDPASRVSRAKANERTYQVLEFLHTKPRVTYLARVRNPNPDPDMPDTYTQPASTREFLEQGGVLEDHHAPGAGGGPGHGGSSAPKAVTGEKGAH